MDKFSFSRFNEKRNYKVSFPTYESSCPRTVAAPTRRITHEVFLHISLLYPPSPNFFQSSDTTGYDEYVEGVEAEETTSLETHIGEVGVASSVSMTTSKQSAASYAMAM